MSNPIESLLNNNPSEFKDAISAALYEKLANVLELKKVQVAESMFGSDEEEDFSDEEENEENISEEEENEELDFEDEDEDYEEEE